MTLAGTFPILKISVGVGLLILVVAAVACYRILSRRRRPSREVLVQDEAPQIVNRPIPAPSPAAKLSAVTPQPETQPVPVGPEPAKPPAVSAFRQVAPKSADGRHPVREADYVWE
ncbi:MAG: hypothetical protein FJ222_04510 [Lentisphaerae bacterium]|nr:hypothetical protein [Lentisphaerota bacterium]